MNLFRYLAPFMLLLSLSEPIWAQQTDLNENQIKAAYLYKFASYVDWPPFTFAQADSPLTIAIIGADEVAAELDSLTKARSINGRPLQIKSLEAGQPLTGIQVLFIGQQARRNAFVLPEDIKIEPVLTVTDSRNGLDSGSIINFVMVDDHIRFEVSTAHADRCGLKISARLLGVAQRIETGRPL